MSLNSDNYQQQLEKDFSRNVWCLLGLPFDAVNMSQTIEIIRQAAKSKSPCFLSTPNLNFLCAAQTDEAFKLSVINSELSIADGFPIILIAKLLNIPLPERVAGSDLMEQLYKQKNDQPLKVFFFGGAEGVGKIACEKINQSPSGIKAVGCYTPGFGSVDEMSSKDIIEQINQAESDFLIVSLGAKKGQAWIEKNRNQLNAPVISHLGAVINFFAGSVKRAPKIMQRLGLEWLWRIYQEPQLWRRYFDDGKTFLILFMTKVIPYWWWIQSHQKVLKTQTTLEIVNISETNENTLEFVLSGAATVNSIDYLRKPLIDALLKHKNIVFDLKSVTIIDGAFIGLLLLLNKHLLVSDLSLKLTNVNKRVKKLFNWNNFS